MKESTTTYTSIINNHTKTFYLTKQQEYLLKFLHKKFKVIKWQVLENQSVYYRVKLSENTDSLVVITQWPNGVIHEMTIPGVLNASEIINLNSIIQMLGD